MLGAIKRRVWILALVAGVVLAAAGTAFAGGNNVHAGIPAHVVVSKKHHQHPYFIKLTGTAAGTKHLYLFVDSAKCGPNPKVEYSRTGADGTAYGYYWKKISGSFSRQAGFRTLRAGPDHACAYLANSSAPRNGAGGVVAHSFKVYQVHS
jgi:hypothetical protein